MVEQPGDKYDLESMFHILTPGWGEMIQPGCTCFRTQKKFSLITLTFAIFSLTKLVKAVQNVRMVWRGIRVHDAHPFPERAPVASLTWHAKVV